MAKIAQSMIELIGNTPLVELSHYNQKNGIQARLIAKVEYFNPSGSVKCRIGNAMIVAGEKAGLIQEGTTIIEPTSGNTGIALAFAAAAKGYRLILVMPDTMSIERRNLLKAYGAELVLTPGSEGMSGAIKKAQELSAEIPGSYVPQQFENPANPEIHRRTTAEEIWRDTDGEIDIFVGGVGTGGTISRRRRSPQGQEAWCSDHCGRTGRLSRPFRWPQGSAQNSGHRCGFVPKNYNGALVDEIFPVSNEQAFETSRALARSEGLLVGISSGAAAYAATQIALRPENAGKTIVVLLPDNGERYLSTTLFQEG